MPRSWFGAAAVITDASGRILLVHHTYGARNWELPGGVGEEGESACDAAVREVREETGLEALGPVMTGVYYEPSRDMHHFVFRCRVTGGKAPFPDLEEVSECAFSPIDALPRPITDFTIRRIEEALAADRTPALRVIGPRRLIE